MELSFHNKIRQKLGNISINDFERLMNDLMRYEFIYEGTLECNQTLNLKARKGKPDAHIKTKEGKYIVFNYTTTEQRNIKGKIKKDIQELFHENCPFRNHISKIITCTNTPLDENRLIYEALANEYGCQYEIYSVDRICDLLKNRNKILKKYFNLDTESDTSIKYYDCGKRIKILREQRNLTRSQLIELINIKSEKELESVEEKYNECSSLTVDEIVELTGCRSDWLKHGLGTMYPQTKFMDLKKEKICDEYYYTNVENAYFCIEPGSMKIIILIKHTCLKYAIINYDDGTSFKIWKWIGDTHKIRNMFHEIISWHKKLNKQFPTGLVISKEEYENLISFNYYPSAIFNNLKREGIYWVEDLMYMNESTGYITFSDKYDWFLKWKPDYVKYYLEKEYVK